MIKRDIDYLLCLKVRLERKHPKHDIVHKKAYLTGPTLVVFLDALPQILTLLTYLKGAKEGEDRGATTVPIAGTRQVSCNYI